VLENYNNGAIIVTNFDDTFSRFKIKTVHEFEGQTDKQTNRMP